jgi:nicotinate-nucleotide adenylyltransferase
MDQPAGGGKRFAFFGGSFDPPHLGHLAIARAARAALDLGTVLFAPVGAQPLKLQGSTASFEDRVEMTRLAIRDEAGFELSLVDAPRSSGIPNYTLDTLLGLRAELPPDGLLYCLMGADSFLGLRRWHRGAEIPFAAPLIVASRPGQLLDDLTATLPVGLTIEAAPDLERPGSLVDLQTYRLRNQAGDASPFYLLPGLHVEISASEIRAQVRNASSGPSFEPELLPAAVADYIRTRGLYR